MNTRSSLNSYLHLVIGLVVISGFLLVGFSGSGQARAPQGQDSLQTPSVTDAPDLQWSNFQYIYAAGSTLKTRNSAQTWANSADGGCIYANSVPSEVMNLHLDIPTGSRIDYLRIFYYDTSASNSQAWVTTYNGAGGYSDVLSVTSTGNTGYGTALSAYVGHVVNNANNAYVLNWRPVASGSTMMLCGLRVAYRLALTEIFIPHVSR